MGCDANMEPEESRNNTRFQKLGVVIVAKEYEAGTYRANVAGGASQEFVTSSWCVVTL